MMTRGNPILGNPQIATTLGDCYDTYDQYHDPIPSYGFSMDNDVAHHNVVSGVIYENMVW